MRSWPSSWHCQNLQEDPYKQVVSYLSGYSLAAATPPSSAAVRLNSHSSAGLCFDASSIAPKKTEETTCWMIHTAVDVYGP